MKIEAMDFDDKVFVVKNVEGKKKMLLMMDRSELILNKTMM